MQFNKNFNLFKEENWIILPVVSSTNSYCKELLAKSTPVLNGSVIMAVEQTHGRGQKKNVWESAPGKNLTFSIILDTGFLPLSKQFQLNQTVCLGILDLLQSYPLSNLSIKWPNDLFVGDKKMGGILIENSISGGRHKHSVIGIGLNINQTHFSGKAGNATSLLLEMQHEVSLNSSTIQADTPKEEFDLLPILKTLLEKIRIRLEMLVTPHFVFLEEDFQRNLFGLGQLRYFRHRDRIFQGTILGVNAIGELKILSDGIEEIFGLHELFFIF